MNLPSLLPRILMRAALCCLVFAASLSLQAQLVWVPGDGWQIEGDSPERTVSGRKLASGLMMMTMAREAQTDGHERLALRRYKQVIELFGASVLAPEAHFQSALIRIDRKQWTKAFQHLQTIVDSHPEYPGFEEVIRHQYEIADALRQGERLRLFGTFPGFRSPEQAVEYFEQVVENAPFSEIAPIALLKSAETQRERGKIEEAIDFYDRFISDYPDHEKIPDAYFGLAEAVSSQMKGPAYDQAASQEAMSYYQDFILLYPRHPRAGEAEARIRELSEVLAESRIVLGDFYFYKRSNYPAARVFYNEAITVSPLSSTAEEARAKLLEVERRAEAR